MQIAGFVDHAGDRAGGGGTRPVGAWLLALAVMVLVMVILGGLTRLTGSGLSMVEWQPLTVLPPRGEAEWLEMFAKYQQSPQYRLVNLGMSLDGFKDIFWLEYIHRLWGRLIGFAFLLPFLFFIWRGRISRVHMPRLLLLFLLGGAQGAIGWLMVKSGLAERPEVSHYRLVAHLLAALAIYAALLWSALDFLDQPAPVSAVRLRAGLAGLLGLIVLTMAAGGLVAGLHAGLIYNSFPMMGDGWLPGESFDLQPLWRNFLENHALVQFDHRLLAAATFSGALVLGLGAWRSDLPGWLRRRLAMLSLFALLQASLGIATLLLVVPVSLAAAHQAGAFLLFGAALFALHGLAGSRPA